MRNRKRAITRPRVWGLIVFLLFLLGLVTGLPLMTRADDQGDAWANKKSAWLALAATERSQV